MSEGDIELKDVLIRADPDEIADKLRENMDNPSNTECYWSVTGTPQETERGQMIYFSDGSGVWGTATVTRLEQGAIWFKPIRRADWFVADLPIDPPTRGFAYIPTENGEGTNA